MCHQWHREVCIGLLESKRFGYKSCHLQIDIKFVVLQILSSQAVSHWPALPLVTQLFRGKQGTGRATWGKVHQGKLVSRMFPKPMNVPLEVGPKNPAGPPLQTTVSSHSNLNPSDIQLHDATHKSYQVLRAKLRIRRGVHRSVGLGCEAEFLHIVGLAKPNLMPVISPRLLDKGRTSRGCDHKTTANWLSCRIPCLKVSQAYNWLIVACTLHQTFQQADDPCGQQSRQFILLTSRCQATFRRGSRGLPGLSCCGLENIRIFIRSTLIQQNCQTMGPCAFTSQLVYTCSYVALAAHPAPSTDQSAPLDLGICGTQPKSISTLQVGWGWGCY